MKAKMTIDNLSIPYERITMVGGRLSTDPAGHHFDLSFRINVKPRTFSKLSGTDIDCPVLQWNERIEWFRYDDLTQQWVFVDEVDKDMYAFKPTSNTFRIWHSYRYVMATDETNHPPAALKAMKSDEDAKKWIAEHGFSWNLAIRDVPAMGITGGSGGGGGDSLVTGNTRRRVIYFDLGFSGHAQRVRLVQILETFRGQLTICHLIRGDIQKATVDHPQNLARWRFELATGAR
ncbi:hypothetical protein PQR46_28415 [Paraburkholderia sediminicola]|uniref:hypothetical protein n=1 Tax=Paraburkholderia TaxID=1822464 RepID=UPI0038B9892F